MTKPVRPMQIVIAPQRARPADSIGVTGPERRMANLADKWRGHGVDPIVCYPDRGSLLRRFWRAGLTTVDFEIGSKFNLGAARAIASLATRNRATLIHTQGPASLDALATLGARMAKLPLVVTRPVMIEDQVHYSARRRWMYAIVDRLVTMRSAARVIAVSSVGYRHLRDTCSVPQERLRLIYNGIDLDRFVCNVPGAAENAVPRRLVVGMVAQLFPPKGWTDFIEIIDRLRQDEPGVLGLIVGEGELREALKREVARRGMGQNVEFTGFIEDTTAAFARMDIFLFTSHREGLSVAVIEALASGKPVIATEVGGIREQVRHGYNGYVAAVGDIDGMACHCAELIRDGSLRRLMGLRSRTIAEESFSETAMLTGYVDCYREIDRERTSRTRQGPGEGAA